MAGPVRGERPFGGEMPEREVPPEQSQCAESRSHMCLEWGEIQLRPRRVLFQPLLLHQLCALPDRLAPATTTVQLNI